MAERTTLIDFFKDLVTERGEFLVYDDGFRRRSYSYDQVGRAARGFAARLTAGGIAKDSTVILWGENRPEWIAAYWGCVIAGIVVVPIDYRSSPDFVVRVRRVVDARVVLVGEDIPAVDPDDPVLHERVAAGPVGGGDDLDLHSARRLSRTAGGEAGKQE